MLYQRRNIDKSKKCWTEVSGKQGVNISGKGSNA